MIMKYMNYIYNKAANIGMSQYRITKNELLHCREREKRAYFMKLLI